MIVKRFSEVIFFAISPAGPAALLCVLAGAFSNHIIYGILIAFPVGLFAILLFFIPASVVGIVYTYTHHLHYIAQELLCCVSGFVFTLLYWWAMSSFGDSNFSLYDDATIMFVWSGALTGFIVARILNFLKHRELKKTVG